MKDEVRKRRAERRAAVAHERAEHLKELAEKRKTHRRFFKAKARSGDALTIQFEFSDILVPVANPDDPDGKALVRDTHLAKIQEERAGQKDN